MKHISGNAVMSVAASVEDCAALLEAVDDYPKWHSDVTEVLVLQRVDQRRPAKVRAKLRVSVGPLRRDLDLVLLVDVQHQRTVTLTRVPHDPADEERFQATWLIQPGPVTRIGLELEANLDVPRLVPLGGVGDAIAGSFVIAAATALRSARG